MSDASVISRCQDATALLSPLRKGHHDILHHDHGILHSVNRKINQNIYEYIYMNQQI